MPNQTWLLLVVDFSLVNSDDKMMSSNPFDDMSYPTHTVSTSNSARVTSIVFDGNDGNDHSKNETIHSGHFMVSEISETDENGENEKVENGTIAMVSEPDYKKTACKSRTKTYELKKTSNHLSIDQSLWKLFQCMTLAYNNGKLTSPKWKTFKGLKMNIKDKIRMNNIIWRAWHIQYVSGRKPEVCQFSSNIDTERHKKTEAILLEGKYWKRRVDVVKAEYNKWRVYYQHIIKTATRSRIFQYDWENNLPRWSNNLSFDSIFSSPTSCGSDPIQPLYDNIPLSYTNFHNYANSREIARSGMGAEFMQPGLEQLQPNIDFMDTFEPIQDFISFREHLPTLPEEQAEFNANNHEIKELENPQELFDSIFPNVDLGPTSLKPMLDPGNSYEVSTNIFATDNFPINNNNKINGQNQYLNASNRNYDELAKPLIILPSASDENDYGSFVRNQNSSFTLNPDQTAQALNTVAVDNLTTNNSFSEFRKYKINIYETTPASAINSLNNGSPFALPPTNNQGSKQILNQNDNHEDSIPHTFDQGSYFLPCESSSMQNDHQQHSHDPAAGINHNAKRSLINVGPKNHRSLSRGNNKNQSLKTLSTTPQSSTTNICEPRQTFGSDYQNSFIRNMERSTSLPACDRNLDKKFDSINDNETMSNFPKENYLSELNLIHYEHKTKLCEQNCLADQQPQTLLNSSIGPDIDGDRSYVIGPAKTLANAQYCSQKIDENSSSNTSNLFQPNLASIIGNETNGSNRLMSSTAFNSTNTAPKARHKFGSHSRKNHQQIFTNRNNSFDSKKNSHSSLDYRNLREKAFIISTHQQQSHQTNLTLSDGQSGSNKLSVGSKSSDIGNDPPHFSSYKEMAPSSGSNSPPQHSSFQSHLGLSTLVFKNEERILYKERRRVCHINAEQKRRCNIKNGFDTLRNLLPCFTNNTNSKISKAAMLHKAADYIRVLKNEKVQQQKEYEMLRQQVESLNQAIGMFQNQLPTTGAPMVGPRINRIKEQYAKYVQQKTIQNWKFWIFSIIMESLLDSYFNTVATSNFDEMCKTLFRWLDQGCCLVNLRKDVLRSLRFVSTSTNILTSPQSIREEILQAITEVEQDQEQDPDEKKFAFD